MVASLPVVTAIPPPEPAYPGDERRIHLDAGMGTSRSSVWQNFRQFVYRLRPSSRRSFPSGLVLNCLPRAAPPRRRVAETYLLGHDRTVWAVPRGLAHALSAYERAFLRLFVMALLDDLFVPDAPFVWLARRVVFALARRPRDAEGVISDDDVGLSGWMGNVWVVAVWSIALGGGIWLLRRWLPA